jgi:hypothetical protein
MRREGEGEDEVESKSFGESNKQGWGRVGAMILELSATIKKRNLVAYK